LIEASVRPRGPYSLRLSGHPANDATRTFADGRLSLVLRVDGRPERALAWQGADGTVSLRAESEAGLDQLRFVLAVDDDHTPFINRFARDPLLGETVRALRGLRPLRLSTVAHALLRALCEQLIQTRRARAIEYRVVRMTTPRVGGLHSPPIADDLARFSAAELRAVGLHARRAATLVRLCRGLDLERLRTVCADAAAARLVRERGLGPWSIGVICLKGLGRYEYGLVGDLGLIKLCAALRGRWADAADTAELLEPYGEWAGLASVYLLAGYSRGLIRLPLAA
jgi:3-methyladenine DNA glycosylase/8-oxoguanine DNA glycosylase